MNIREMRAQLGDTQSEFSARYHIPFRTVQNWETGMRKPPEYVSVGAAYQGGPDQPQDLVPAEV